MDNLRKCLFDEAQQGVALITHNLFEKGLIPVDDAKKSEAKKVIANVLHNSRRRLENKFCKEEGSAQTDGRGAGEAG